MIYGLGPDDEWELDEDLWELRRGGDRVFVQPKILALLFYLARNRERVVTGDELLRELWPKENVTASSLARAISLARAALADRERGDRVLQTVPRRGYRLRASALDSARRAASERRGPALIGRADALGALLADLGAVRAGAGRVRILRGEAGIGKTRLADELSAQAASEGALVCTAWCVPESGQPALWPWIRVARALLAALPTVEPRRRARIRRLRERVAVGGAAGRLEQERDTPAPELRAGASEFETVDGLAAALELVARKRPIVIVLDDIQWADIGSLRVLELLPREIAASGVYILAALRDDELETSVALRSCLGLLERLPHADVLRLERLGRPETEALVRETWGAEVSPDLCDYVWRAGAGNPLFTTELVRHLRARGAGSIAHDSTLAEPPASLRAILDAKVARASDASRELLAVFAVIGAEVEVGLLCDALGASVKEATSRLEELERLGVLAPCGATSRSWRFSHPLARELVLAGLSRAERARHHARAAEALERGATTNPEGVASELAAHYLAIARAGGPSASALTWSERAARIALRRCAYDESAHGFAGALEALRMDRVRDAREELRLLLVLGEAHARANALWPAAEAAEQAATLARQLGDSDAFARAALLLFVRGPESGGPFARIVSLLEDAESASRGSPGPLRARVLARLSNELVFVPGTIERRVALAQEAVELGARADPETRIFVGYYASIGVWPRLRAAERASRMAELICLADDLGDPSARFLVSAPYIASQLECGRLDEVDLEIERLAHKVESLSVPSFFCWYTPLYRAMRALIDGRFDEAERLSVLANSLGLRARSQDSARNHAGQIASLRREQGRVGEVEGPLRGLREKFARISLWRAAFVQALCEGGKLDEARAELAAWFRDGLPDPLADSNGVVSLVVLGDVCSELNARDCAAEILQRLERYAGENAAPAFGAVCVGSVDRVLGLLASALGRRDEAIARLRGAERASERQGARPMLARVRLGLAQALRARSAPGDSAAARELAASASALAESLEMPLVASQARALV